MCTADGEPTSTRSVVVVDDEPDIRRLVRLLAMQLEDVTVTEAADAFDAVNVIARRQPDVAVLDINLGGPLTGVDLIPLVRKVAPACRIVLYTATATPVVGQSAADAVVLKTSTDELVAVLRTLIER